MHHHFFQRARRCGADFESMFEFGRRGGHGPGFGPFAGFMGGGGLGGHGMRGRKLGSGELQIVLLALLADRSSHGYELIKALDERSSGFYSPSPGMVYPALTYLEEVGYASVEPDGAKKLYSITDAGREYLEKNRATAQAILEQLEKIGARMGRVRDAFSGRDEDDDEGGPAEIWHALRELKSALRSRRRHAGGGEARRIADILQRAARDILGED